MAVVLAHLASLASPALKNALLAHMARIVTRHVSVLTKAHVTMLMAPVTVQLVTLVTDVRHNVQVANMALTVLVIVPVKMGPTATSFLVTVHVSQDIQALTVQRNVLRVIMESTVY
jgi:hypothetical protein